MDRILGFFDEPMLINLAMQLFNTAVMCAILAFLVYIPVKTFLQKRAQRIADQVETAARDFEDAKRAKAEYDAAMLQIDKERVEILETARRHALEKEREIIARAKEEARVIKDRAMQDISLEEKRARVEMKNQLVELSAIIAERFVTANIDDLEHNKLIDNVIAELGDANWGN